MYSERIGYSLKFAPWYQRTFLMNDVRKLSPSYAAAEVLWYMGGDPDVSMLKHYAPSYEKFADKDNKAHGAYGPRAMPNLPAIIDVLQRQPWSRQAVVPIFTSEDLCLATVENTVTDIPCTLSWQFLVRDDQLHMVVNMRSNDAWLGFPYDVFAFTCFQRVIAAHLGIQIGTYTHNVGSMHLYAKHKEKAERAAQWKTWTKRLPSNDWHLDDTLTSCALAVRIEKGFRRVYPSNVIENFEALGSMTKDLVAACATFCGWESPRPKTGALNRCPSVT